VEALGQCKDAGFVSRRDFQYEFLQADLIKQAWGNGMRHGVLKRIQPM